MRVYVTGGAGFIGSNLVQALLAGGHNVMVVDDLSVGTPDNLDPRAGFRKLDILDEALAAHLAEFAPDVVIHLAAQASVTESLRDPERDRLVNAEGTRRVAAAARDSGARRVISASSAAVYGEPSELPLKESSATVPVNPYGASKLEAESLLAGELRGTGLTSRASASLTCTGRVRTRAGKAASSRSSSTAWQTGEAPVSTVTALRRATSSMSAMSWGRCTRDARRAGAIRCGPGL